MGDNDDPNAIPVSFVQAYNIKEDTWQSVNVQGEALNHHDRYWSMHASSFEGGGKLSWMAGGIDNLTGMVTFDATNPTQPSWKNETANIPYFRDAATQYVRFGDAGIIVSVGGFSTQSTINNVGARREMNSVQVYDIAAEKWFLIFATGAAPLTISNCIPFI